ncbi:glycerone kinase [Singulisphaera sp. PoT]|uniref:glycerone kinase n=1 Tax=Singulisphaera sp. PoT TaxID=3411797 RepID=UPI003BF57DD1
MKKLINRPEAVVEEMVEGLVAIDPRIVRVPGQTVVVRADADSIKDRQVTLISGGGSGHEPAHAGYVGRGMLSAAVAGEVFTSPSADAVLAAIRAVGGKAGVLLIVKNYTGDRLNFGLAAEMARAEGIEVEMVIVADDVALAATTENAGRRGIAGTVLVHKVAGAAAEAGASLAEVLAEARATAEAVGTMGVGLSPCTVPASGKPGFSLADDEIELGLGIHGEPGVRRGPLEPADQLVDQILAAIAGDAGLIPNERVVLLINNLGATPAMELAIVARRALEVLEGQGLVVERAYVGTFLSALEMAGVSLSVLRVDDARLARLDATADAPAWQPAPARNRLARQAAPTKSGAKAAPLPSQQPQTPLGVALRNGIVAAAEAVIAEAPRLTELDQVVGDGDLGINLERGARAILDDLDRLPCDAPAETLHQVGLTLQRVLGGTSGALYGVFFLRASSKLKQASIDDPRAWADALQAGTNAIAELGGARPGDRTMLDALAPAAETLYTRLYARSTLEDAISSAADAAKAAAEATATLQPRKGRSSYLGERTLGHPDPGAIAVATWLRAIAESLSH